MLERFRERAGRRQPTGDRAATTAAPAAGAVAPARVRGGVSPGGVITGVVVALGALFIFSALITGILAALGVQEAELSPQETLDVGIATGIGVVVALFLAYGWGGYTAGRMGRGAGVLNGILVPIVAFVVIALLGGIIASVASNADVDLPFRVDLPFSPRSLTGEQDARDWGLGLGIAAVVAMVFGGAMGGALGSRWHTKLERAHYQEAVASRPGQTEWTQTGTRADAATSPQAPAAQPPPAAARDEPAPTASPEAGPAERTQPGPAARTEPVRGEDEQRPSDDRPSEWGRP